MRLQLFLAAVLVLACSSFCPAQVASTTSIAHISAKDLITRIETQYQGKTSHGKTRMTIQTRDWQRVLEMEYWSEGRDKFLTRILSPRKEKGTCTLKVNDNIWNYIPRIDRMIKIPSSLMGESWMGSHLTNDDLVKENKIDELYNLEIIASDTKQITIQGIPFPDAAVVWGKILYVIDAEKLVPVYVDYFDEEGIKVRRIDFSEPVLINGRWIPKTMKILPIEKPDEFTKLKYTEIEFDVKLQSNLFSMKSLRNR
ncbi:MAG: outer membrane lipoprotein-sorting protein [Candidatus Rifleibacteriota bacterium]